MDWSQLFAGVDLGAALVGFAANPLIVTGVGVVLTAIVGPRIARAVLRALGRG